VKTYTYTATVKVPFAAITVPKTSITRSPRFQDYKNKEFAGLREPLSCYFHNGRLMLSDTDDFDYHAARLLKSVEQVWVTIWDAPIIKD